MTKPNEPTLTCSEVVERLATEAHKTRWIKGETVFPVVTICEGFDREKAEAILHSWRERRVQELEEAVKYMVPRLDQHEELPDWVREIANAL